MTVQKNRVFAVFAIVPLLFLPSCGENRDAFPPSTGDTGGHLYAPENRIGPNETGDEVLPPGFDPTKAGAFIADVTAPEKFAACAHTHDSHGWTEAVPGLMVGETAPVPATVVQWFDGVNDRDGSDNPTWAAVPRSERFRFAARDRYAIAEVMVVGFDQKPVPEETKPVYFQTLGEDNTREGFSECDTVFTVHLPENVTHAAFTVSYDFSPGSDLRADELLMSTYFVEFTH